MTRLCAVVAIVLAPFALAYLVYAGLSDGGAAMPDVWPIDRPGLFLLLLGTGVVTAVPLALFAAGARRLSLTAVGLMQYIAPSIQFLLALYVYGEEVEPVRLATFGLIWVSLAIFTTDTLVRHERSRG